MADCASVAVASYYQAILARVGAERFDKYFAEGGKHALVIGQYPDKGPLKRFLKHVDRGSSIRSRRATSTSSPTTTGTSTSTRPGCGRARTPSTWATTSGAASAPRRRARRWRRQLVDQYNSRRDKDDEDKLNAGGEMPDGTKRNPDGSRPQQYRFPGEPGADGDGTLPVTIDEQVLRAGGGGLQASGWRVGDEQVDEAFPE